MDQEQDYLIFRSQPRQDEKIMLLNLPVVIGRTSPAEVIIDIQDISRRHARISREAGVYLIEDLGSSNGTYLNNQRIETAHQFQPGDMLRFGASTTLELVAAPAPAPAANATVITTVSQISHADLQPASHPVLSDETREAVIFGQAITKGDGQSGGEPLMAPPTAVPPDPGGQSGNETSIGKGTSRLGGKVGDATSIGTIPPVKGGKADDSTSLMPGLADLPPASEVAAQLVVNESGQQPRIINLGGALLRIGRLPDNDVVINNRFVSRYHAELERRGTDYYLSPLPNISNALLVDGSPVMEPVRLRHGMKIRLGGWAQGEMTSLDFISLNPEADLSQQKIQFKENTLITIGRHPDNKLVLAAPVVSNFHAEVEKIGQRYRVKDLKSSNGTYVNGKSVIGETWVHPGDAIQIGPYRFVVDENEMSGSDQSQGGVKVEVFGLNKWVNKKLNILQDISLAFNPKEFIVVVGQSGGGKSTLVDAITGYRPATKGKVLVNGVIDVYKEFDAMRTTIGYVPQKDIIHMELTVFQALDYAAQLRMPADTSRQERLKRIDEVLSDLDLSHRRDTQISTLSGGQQKRVSIGVELLTKPGLFFLDEPTSGLDPGMETELMRLMRKLADQGRTIVMITHATKNVMLADKVVFLAKGGFLTWFGPPEEALTYFDQYRSARDRRSSPMEFDNIYTLLDKDELGKGSDWAERFRNHAAYFKYIAEPLKQDMLATGPKPSPQAAARQLNPAKQVSALRQFFILSSRNIKILTRDPFSLALLLLTAPLMASMDFTIAAGGGTNPVSFQTGSFNGLIITLVVLTNTTILVGGLSFMRELVKERDIYKRERMVNLKLSSYIVSKIWIALIIALYQAACFTVIRYMAFDMPGGLEEKLFMYITIFLLILAGMMMGFFSSALAPNANSAPLLLIMFIIPQMVLSGALVPLAPAVMAPASSHWAVLSAIAIGGAGSDVAADSCWALPKDKQDDLTLDQKNTDCTCMGENALRESSCNFPGLGKYYDVAIDTLDPAKPKEPGAQPAEPKFPDPPAKPADVNNVLMLQKYLSDLDTYTKGIDVQRSNYQTQIDDWKKEQDSYKTAIETYQKDLTDLEVKRAIGVGSAEATIRRYKDDYGWTFINKQARAAYMDTLYQAWGASLLIILILFVGTIVLQKRHDN
ncbi:MAG: FHA domain-containing protein [Chloroflexi bacterium]|nr:FHA domain-containing protein [Chloroflexota bacterium]